MSELISKNTFFLKKILPIIWFGFLAVFIFAPSLAGGSNKATPAFFVLPIIMVIFGYIIFKKFIFDLIDEVYDEGESLLFKNAGKEVKINLRDIKNVNYQMMMNPPRVTLSLRYDTDLGKELSFSVPKSFSLSPFKKNEVIEDLIDRIDQAKR